MDKFLKELFGESCHIQFNIENIEIKTFDQESDLDRIDCGFLNYENMGQFSWITQDTNESVQERYTCNDSNLTTAYLHDNKGNIWEEKNYEGYGVFGGKDYYQLLAEMNEVEGLSGVVDEDRLKGIKLAFSDIPHVTPNITRHINWLWINEAPQVDPNQGWGDLY